MKGRNTIAIGIMAMMAVTGMVQTPSSFAADTNRGGVSEERIGHGGSYVGSQPDGAIDCQVAGEEPRKADVSKRIGAGGSIYVSSQTTGCQAAGEERPKMDVSERVGAGGSIYSSSRQVMSQR